MKLVAINPDTSHRNENTLYLACTGGGKSQALLNNKNIPKKGARVLLWDIDEDHKATRFETMPLFLKAVVKGIRSGKGFRLAYCGNDSLDNFEKFCEIAFSVLDGNKNTYIIIEEQADVSPTTTKATYWFGKLLRKGRKFGAKIHVTSQRGAEISKTAYTQCMTKYVGQQQGSDILKMAIVANVSANQIKELKPLEFWRTSSNAGESVKIKIKYKKP